DPADVVVGQLPGTPLRIHARLATNIQGEGRPDAEDVAQGNMRRFVLGKVYTENTRHALPLLAFSPGVVCDGGWSRSRTTAPGGARSCSFRKYVSRWPELSWLTPPTSSPKAQNYANDYCSKSAAGSKGDWQDLGIGGMP